MLARLGNASAPRQTLRLCRVPSGLLIRTRLGTRSMPLGALFSLYGLYLSLPHLAGPTLENPVVNCVHYFKDYMGPGSVVEGRLKRIVVHPETSTSAIKQEGDIRQSAALACEHHVSRWKQGKARCCCLNRPLTIPLHEFRHQHPD